MAEGKRYYWLKLKDDFFDSLRIKKLRKIAGGDTYTIIYLKMQLKAIKSGGVLTYRGLENNFASELALDIDEDEDDVRITLQYLTSCGLCECSDNVNFFLPYVAENTGSETASTQRWREWNNRQKVLDSNTTPTFSQQIANAEKDIEIEKEIEIDIERENNAPARESRHKYGEYKNVLLSDEELEKLKAEFADWQARIERLSSYIASTGKSYKNHLATIRNWARADAEKNPKKAASFDTSEFFDAAVRKSYSGG